MYQHIVVVLILVNLGYVWPAPLSEDETVKSGMQSAFHRGLSVFGGSIKRGPESSLSQLYVEPKIHSTHINEALGGGKPSLVAQYNRHHYTPPVSVVVPKHFGVPEHETLPIHQYYMEEGRKIIHHINSTVDKQPSMESLQPGVVSPRPLSHHDKDLVALGGGKPALTEQYRKHHYTPLAPTFIPKTFESLTPEITPDLAARIFVPSRPLQYTVERLRTP